MRSPEALKTVLDAAEKALAEGIEDISKLNQLKEILTRKLRQPGTKVQVKPVFKRIESDLGGGIGIGGSHSRSPSSSGGGGGKNTAASNNQSLLGKVQLIVKWGGEFTHAGRHHSHDLGDNLRKDLMIMNRKILDDVKIYTSSERRVIATADIFAKALLKVAELHQEYLIINKEML